MEGREQEMPEGSVTNMGIPYSIAKEFYRGCCFCGGKFKIKNLVSHKGKYCCKRCLARLTKKH